MTSKSQIVVYLPAIQLMPNTSISELIASMIPLSPRSTSGDKGRQATDDVITSGNEPISPLEEERYGGDDRTNVLHDKNTHEPLSERISTKS